MSRTARRLNRKPKPEFIRWLERVDDRFMGTPIDVDPHEALLQAIRIAAGEVYYCDRQISRLEEDLLFERPARKVYTRLPSGHLELIEVRRNEEQMNRWVQWRKDATDRMARYSKMAIDAGIDERRVAVAERVADVLAPLLQNLADDLHLTPKQRALLPDIIGMRLRALEQGATS